jgi:hypothetical protein
MINFKDYLVGFGFILVIAIFLIQKIRDRRDRKRNIIAKKRKKKGKKRR